MSVYETFDEQKQFACRVIADHARTTAFAVADGILPGNEGRNYVLRKIMRRAIYHGREHLGFQDLFFNKVCDFVVEQMKDAYPELEIQREFIGKMVRLEEERFGATMTVGLKKLDEVLSELDGKYKRNIFGVNLTNEDKSVVTELLNDSAALSEKMQDFDFSEILNAEQLEQINKIGGTEGLSKLAAEKLQNEDFRKSALTMLESPPPALIDDLAKLYDTFGTPKDLIRLKLDEKTGVSIPEDYFDKKFNEALIKLQQSSEIGKTKQADKINPIYADLHTNSVRSNFHGYEKTEVADAQVIALVKDDQKVDELREGDEGLIILDETPFYAESGGQIGDAGTIQNSKFKIQNSENPLSVHVFDTFAPIKEIVLHKSKIEKGSIRVGDVVTATVDIGKRDAIRRNHTATHLVHSALKEVLGTHVKQAGSVVAPNFLRFDFTHYQPISPSELLEIEDLVNREILKNDPVKTNLMPIEEAMRSGAMALFGEKYGATVRVLSIGGGEFSKELCGGTHVRATGDIGSFKITSDEAVASGVRRIRAITGLDAFARFREDENLIEKSLGALRTQRDNLPLAIEKLQEELKKVRRENDDLKMKIATGATGGAAANEDEAREINGVKVIAKTIDGLDKGGMRHLSDTLMSKIKSGVVILARTEDDKVSFIVRVSDDLTGKIKAGEIVKQIAPIVGGRGGGKPDMAEGGGTDAGKLNEALKASYEVVAQMAEN